MEKITKSLIKKIKKTKQKLKEELKYDDHKKPNDAETFRAKDNEIQISENNKNTITVEKAKQLQKLRKNLNVTFKKEKLDEISGLEAKEKE